MNLNRLTTRRTGFTIAPWLMAWWALLGWSAALFAGGTGPDFTEVDRKVRALPRTATLDEVPRQLSGCARTDWEKTRAIWIWLTENIAYDAEGFFSGAIASVRETDVFARRTSVCAGYSRLFAWIGKRMDLEVLDVVGKAKGYTFDVNGQLGGHAWTAVRLDGGWHLFDSTWGAGHVGNDRRFHKAYNEYWFDTPPPEMAFSHCPDNPGQSFLNEPFNEARFRTLPHMEKSFQDWKKMGFTLPGTISELAALKGPKTWATYDHPIRVIDVPFADRLQSGKACRFVFTAAGITKAAIIHNGQWTMLSPKDGVFSAQMTPRPGSLKVSLYFSHEGQSSYWTALEYPVD